MGASSQTIFHPWGIISVNSCQLVSISVGICWFCGAICWVGAAIVWLLWCGDADAACTRAQALEGPMGCCAGSFRRVGAPLGKGTWLHGLEES